MTKVIIKLSCMMLLTVSLPALAKHYYDKEYCGRMPIYETSTDVPPLSFDIFVRGNHSNWQAVEEFRLQYKGNNIYQLRANFPSFTNYKLASESWSDQFWIPTPSGDFVEQQGPQLGREYALNWIETFPSNKSFATGDLLFTFEIAEGAERGDRDAAFLTINACDKKQQKQFGREIKVGKKNNIASTVASMIGANGSVSLGFDGNIYVSNFGTFGSTGTGSGETIVQVKKNGEHSVFVDGLTGPQGQRWASDGNLYVVNGSNFTSGQFMRITPEGEKTVIAEIPGFPSNFVEDKDGNFYVSNFANNLLTKVDSYGNQEPFADHPDLNGLVGMVYDKKSEMIVGANTINGKILTIDDEGNVEIIAQIPSPTGHIAMIGRKIYATGIFSNRVYQVSFNGKVKLIGGSGEPVSQDGATPRMQFNNPNGMTADPENKILYMSEFGGDNNLRSIQLR